MFRASTWEVEHLCIIKNTGMRTISIIYQAIIDEIWSADMRFLCLVYVEEDEGRRNHVHRNNSLLEYILSTGTICLNKVPLWSLIWFLKFSFRPVALIGSVKLFAFGSKVQPILYWTIFSGLQVENWIKIW